MIRVMRLVLGLVMILILASCSNLTEKRMYRVGLAKKVSTIAPYFYQNYLPKQIKIHIMPLNDASQLKTALLVEAVDLAILPISIVLEEQTKTKQLKIIASIEKNNLVEDGRQVVMALVAKKSMLDKYGLPMNNIIQAHQQSVGFLNNNHQAWQEQAVAIKLEEKSVKEQIANTTLLYDLDERFKNRVIARSQQLVKTGRLDQEPDYHLLWYPAKE